MMRMRRLGIALLVLGVVTAAIYGTGAFSGLTAQRSADVSVTGDASGYIAFRPADGPDGEYAKQNARGELTVQLEDAVNTNSMTRIGPVFTITNQRSKEIGFWLAEKNNAVTFYVSNKKIGYSKDQAIRLEPGEPKSVSLVVNAKKVDGNQDVLQSMNFRASSEVKGRTVKSGTGASSSERSGDGGSKKDNRQPKGSNKPSNTDNGDSDGDSREKCNGALDLGCHGSNFLKEPGKTVEDTIDVTTDFFGNMAEWSRQQFLEKLSYVTNQPLDALKSLGESMWNAVVGFFAGEFGMPGGFMGFEAKESFSPFYLGGALLSAVNPITESLSGIRDFTSNLLDLKPIGAAIELVGLFPPGKVVESIGDLKSTTQAYIKYYPGNAKKYFKPIYDTFLSKLPKGPRKQIVDLFPGSMKRGDEAGSATSKSEDASETRKYNKDPASKIKHLTKEKQHIGYTQNRMNRLVNNEKYTTDQIEDLAKKNVDLEEVEDLSKEGFSKDQVFYFVNNNDGTLLSPSLKELKELSEDGYKPDHLEYIFKNGESKYLVAGPTPSKLKSLSEKGFSSGDVKYYVEAGVPLQLVGKLGKHASPKKVKRFVVTVRKGKKDIMYYGLYRNTKNWCDMNEKNGKEIEICQTLPSVP